MSVSVKLQSALIVTKYRKYKLIQIKMDLKNQTGSFIEV